MIQNYTCATFSNLYMVQENLSLSLYLPLEWPMHLFGYWQLRVYIQHKKMAAPVELNGYVESKESFSIGIKKNSLHAEQPLTD